MRNKVFVFDLDDTLYKEIDFLRSAYREIADWVEVEFSQTDIYPFMIKAYESKMDVFSLMIEKYDLPLMTTDLLRMYRTHKPNIRLEWGTCEMLDVLRQECNLGIITDGYSIPQRNKFCALQLDRFIKEDDLIISEEFGTEKPSKKNYLFFQHKYVNADFVYVGDNIKKEFVSPNRLGWKTVCLLDDGRNIHRQDFDLPEEYLPDFKIPELKDLLTLNI